MALRDSQMVGGPQFPGKMGTRGPHFHGGPQNFMTPVDDVTVLFKKMAYRVKHITTREFWKSSTNLSSLRSIGGECNTR